MKTKIIPFDLETAKKIQAGEIEGRIVTALYDVEMEILTFNSFDKECPIIARYKDIENMDVKLYEYHTDGRTNPDGIHFWFDLNIELPEEAPKHTFKSFDKVLVRDHDKDIWRARIYDYYAGSYHFCQDGHGYNYCISYEGNEHLVGTTDKPKEE